MLLATPSQSGGWVLPRAVVGFNYTSTTVIKPRSFLSWLVSLRRSLVFELRSNMTVRMTAAAAAAVDDQVFLVSAFPFCVKKT